MNSGSVDPEQEQKAEKPGRSRLARISRFLSMGLAMLVLLVGGLFFWALTHTVTLPDWLRSRIETRIEQNLNGMDITFGGVELVVNRGWRPRVALNDVTLATQDGLPIVHLADAQASIAMRPLLQGRVQAKSISLSGVFATLRRDSQGNFSLALGDGTPALSEAPNLVELVEETDRLFLSPALSALVSVEIESVTVQYEDALKNRNWTLDGGHVRLNRDDDQMRIASGFSLLSGSDSASSVEMNYSSRFRSPEAEFGIVVKDIAAQDIAAQTPGLAWFDVLRAPISGALRGGVRADGSFKPLSASLQIGAGVLQPNDSARPIPFDTAHSYFVYDPAEQILVFDEVLVSSNWGSGTAEGQAYLNVANGGLEDLVGQLTLSNLSVNPDGLYEKPLEISRAIADFRLRFSPFRMSLGQLQISQADTRMVASGDLEAGPEGWRVALDGEANAITPDRLMEIWPEFAVPKPREWIRENMSGGQMQDINFALRLHPGKKPDVYLDFDYADTQIKFVKTLPPITGTYGQASLVQGRFVTTATAGRVTPEEGGAVDIAQTSFIIPDVDVKPATPAIVRVSAKSSVTAVMSLLNRPPLAVLKDTTLPVALAEGDARMTGTLALPMKPKVPFEEMEFHLTGEIDDVQSDVLVPDYLLSAPNLAVRGTQTEIIVEGSGQIEAIPVDLQWRQPLGDKSKDGSQIKGTIELSPRTIETFDIGLPPGSVTGRGSGAFEVTLAPGLAPGFTLNSDLKGIGLGLSALGWSKSAASTGLLDLSGQFGAAPRIDKLVLQAAGLAATGSVVNRQGGGLDRALLTSVRIRDWLDASVELVGRGNAAPDIRILSGMLDLRTATFGTGGDDPSQPGDLQVALNRLQVTDDIALTDFAGAFKLAGGLNGRFRGKVNGQTDVTGEVVPNAGRSAVRIISDDAGGVVRSAGVLENARGGKFDMSLLPSRTAGQFDGRLKITNTQVRNAPAIAALLNSISLVGLLDELSGQGIQFANVDAKFRLGPSRITVFESSATGPSIGLSMDGVFDVPNGILKMQGVISPVYLLNQIGNLVARRGEGIIGFNYTLTGTTQSPKVQVNPLSALTPGFLRDIMRSSPPPRDENAPAPKRTPHISPDDASSGR